MCHCGNYWHWLQSAREAEKLVFSITFLIFLCIICHTIYPVHVDGCGYPEFDIWRVVVTGNKRTMLWREMEEDAPESRKIRHPHTRTSCTIADPNSNVSQCHWDLWFGPYPLLIACRKFNESDFWSDYNFEDALIYLLQIQKRGEDLVQMLMMLNTEIRVHQASKSPLLGRSATLENGRTIIVSRSIILCPESSTSTPGHQHIWGTWYQFPKGVPYFKPTNQWSLWNEFCTPLESFDLPSSNPNIVITTLVAAISKNNNTLRYNNPSKGCNPL